MPAHPESGSLDQPSLRPQASYSANTDFLNLMVDANVFLTEVKKKCGSLGAEGFVQRASVTRLFFVVRFLC